MTGGQVGRSMYLEVWKDSAVKLGDATSATDVARSRVTSAPSAPRHWEALQAAPTAACQALELESHTEGNARYYPVLPSPFFLLRSFSHLASQASILLFLQLFPILFFHGG